MTIADDVRDDKRRWKPEKSLAFSKFTSIPFVGKSNAFLRKFVEEKQLFKIVDGKLMVDNGIAKNIAFHADAEFDTRVLVFPVVGKDQQTNLLYEGVAVCIRDLSNHVIFTYEEFVKFVKYLDKFDFDMMALTLLNTALAVNGGINGLSENSVVSSPVDTTYTTIPAERLPTIPNLSIN